MKLPDYIQQQYLDAAITEWQAAMEKFRPSYLYRPRLTRDGNKWCALYGENLVDGVAGFGDSPDEAYREFDKAWYEKPKSNSLGKNESPLEGKGE